MNNLTSEIILNLGGNLTAKARQYGNSMDKFAKRNTKAMNTVRVTTVAAGRALDGLANKYTGLLSGVAAVQTFRSVADFDAQMTRIGTNAQMTIQEVEKLKQKIFEVANQDDIRIDVSTLAAAVDALMTDTGDVQFMEDNLRNLAILLQATGSAAQDAGLMMGAMQRKNVRDQTEVNLLMDRYVHQMSLGSVSIKEASQEARELFALYQGQGVDSMSQLFALLQMFTTTTGSASEAVTSLGAVFEDLIDPKKVAFLQRQGIDLYKEGTEELRAPVELFLEILEAAGDSEKNLASVFSGTATKGLKSLIGSDAKAKIDSMVNGVVSLGVANESAARNAATFDSAMTSLVNVWRGYADNALSQPIQNFADALNSIDKDLLDKLITAGLALGGGLIGYKVLKGGKGILDEIRDDIRGKDSATSGKMGGLLSGDVMPVYVVNMGEAGLDATSSGKGKNKGSKAKGAKTTSPRSGYFSGASKIGGGALSAYTMVEASDWIAKGLYYESGISDWVKENWAPNAQKIDLPSVQVPTFSDAWSDIKAYFSQMGQERAPAPRYLTGEYEAGQSASGYGNRNEIPSGKLEVVVSDDRVRVRKVNAPGISLGVNHGLSMMD